MKNKSLNESPNSSSSISSRIRFSIVWKLNITLFFRMLGIFLVLDLFLCLLAAAGLFIRSEQTVTSAAQLITESGLPAPEAEQWLAINECSITTPTGEPKGIQIPPPLKTYFSKQTASGIRSIDLPNSKGLNEWGRFFGITYNVTIETGDQPYRISFHLQKTLQILVIMFAIVITFELLMLLRSIFTGARIIRNTFRPIQELAQTARNLSTEGVFSPEQLEVLAGKLDDINATHLDTRISVGDTQSELKTLAAAINGMLDRINESYRSQIRFVSDASHELRTPISVIQGYVNLLDRWGKNDEKTLQESIDAIKDETANMKGLVEQLLFLARGDNNTMALQLESFEVSALAEEVLRETQMIDEGHVYDSKIMTVFINGDKSLIKQALRILIDNAMKYTPTGKKITILISNSDNLARLTVQDEGIGIAPEAVSKIFDRFFRTDESRARATGGTGLGLSIAKWITERHGGHIEVLSRQDIGTRISIVLPADQKADHTMKEKNNINLAKKGPLQNELK
ncbi:signal transduction histidine-protein kinase ArlS [Desulfosporosinus acididurans]|uniref:histidine kinase n=1 Tax=Desulfosporosinus acididurans TaxID=476652 RepID=A0A0J1IRM3_9FIRM|nr:HAMP domain-containing sensor histidine kinase [Desulfosporosinus acididurans]KLU67331.1 signal transduction histidine-protein kinase ArlS [Desulfosporosinus acididurans]